MIKLRSQTRTALVDLERQLVPEFQIESSYHAASVALRIGMLKLQGLRTAGRAALPHPHASRRPAVDVSAFREAMGSFPTGVTVVTVASDDGNIHGITVNSFSSVSLDPMLVLICLKKTSRGLGLIERAGTFAVNVLSAGQHDLARRFASRHRPVGPAMFDGVPFEPGVTGCPVLVDATASFDCRVQRSHPAGDHLIVLGEVVALVHRPQLEPLIFHAGTYGTGRRSPSVHSLASWRRTRSLLYRRDHLGRNVPGTVRT